MSTLTIAPAFRPVAPRSTRHGTRRGSVRLTRRGRPSGPAHFTTISTGAVAVRGSSSVAPASRSRMARWTERSSARRACQSSSRGAAGPVSRSGHGADTPFEQMFARCLILFEQVLYSRTRVRSNV